MAIVYLVKTVLASGLFYAYYWLFLRNRAFHEYNRFYLLAVLFISLIIPFVPFTFPGLGQGAGVIDEYTIGWQLQHESADQGGQAVLPHQSPGGNFFTVTRCAVAGYLVIVFSLLYRLFRSIRQIYRLMKWYVWEDIDGIPVCVSQEPGSPFSAFGRIFWDSSLDLYSIKGRQIFRHESYHVIRKHSFDNLLMEIACACGWVNPFFYLIRREMKIVHEFMADRYAALGIDQHDYAELLVLQAIGKAPAVSHPFLSIHLKRRVNMLTQLKTKPAGYAARLFVIPVLLAVCCAFSSGRNHSPNSLHSLHPAGSTGIVKGVSDSGDAARKRIVHHFLRYLRYPDAAVAQNQEITLWIQVKIGEKGVPTEFESYARQPDTDDKKWITITCSALMSEKIGIRDKNSFGVGENDFKDAFRAAVKKATDALATDKQTQDVAPGTYFFKLTFRLEKPTVR